MELLLQWMRKWNIDKNLIYRQAAIDQACFLRDDICGQLLHTHPFVVSTHISKSVTLPVYAFTMRNGIKVICRENFYGWMLSVELPQDKPSHVDVIPEDVFECGYMKDISSCYFEGFKDEWVYEGYNPHNLSQRKFSFGIRSDYDFYMAMYMLKHLYPEIEYTEKANLLTKESIASMISDMYNKFGYNEFEISEGKERRIMKGWEILLYTWHQLDDYDFRKEKGLDYIPYDTPEDVDKFAEEIAKYPETRKVFAMEANMFTATF